jgi:hypothetical protein
MQRLKPVRSRERRTGAGHDKLLARLKRYEELLQAHGIQPNAEDDMSLSEALSPETEDDDGHLFVQDGHARFVESSLWKGLETEVNCTSTCYVL